MNIIFAKKYDSKDKNIGALFIRLPQHKMLNQIKTLAQINYCAYLVVHFTVVSMCWNVLHGGEDAFMYELPGIGKIPDDIREVAWRKAILYRRFWELICISFRDIHPELQKIVTENCPKSNLELFRWVVQDEIDDLFGLCLKHYESSSRKNVKTYKLMAKNYKGKTDEREKLQLQKSMKQVGTGVADLILAICDEKAKKNRLIKESLEDVRVAMYRLGDYMSPKIWHAPSYRWEKGEFLLGKEGGSYSKPL